MSNSNPGSSSLCSQNNNPIHNPPESPYDYVAKEDRRFIPTLLLYILQRDNETEFRTQTMNILRQFLSITPEEKFLRAAFSFEGSNVLKCIFSSSKNFVVDDGFRLLEVLFTAHRDSFLTHFAQTGVVYDVLQHLRGNRFLTSVCGLLRNFIMLSTPPKVTEFFRKYEVLEMLCESARCKLRLHDNDRDVAALELQTVDQFRIRMSISYRAGYTFCMQIVREHGLE